MTDPSTNQYDRDILAEAAREREHRKELAKIDANTKTELAREDRLKRAARFPYVVGAVVALCATAIIIAIVLAISRASSEDRQNRENERNRQVQLAETCIQEGNIWVNNSCLVVKPQ